MLAARQRACASQQRAAECPVIFQLPSLPAVAETVALPRSDKEASSSPPAAVPSSTDWVEPALLGLPHSGPPGTPLEAIGARWGEDEAYLGWLSRQWERVDRDDPLLAARMLQAARVRGWHRPPATEEEEEEEEEGVAAPASGADVEVEEKRRTRRRAWVVPWRGASRGAVLEQFKALGEEGREEEQWS